ncbi:hypothetical protein BDEG_24979 [Batrachochytrium dendrobatidis JEL423]|nr:hypothetical protein BDEG_24979 [Batrachochytrium dendrobatidis JEL423]
MDAVNSSIFDEDWRNIFDPIDPSTSSQDQQHPMYQPDLNTSEEYWKFLMNEISLSTPEDWQEIIDAVNSKNSNQDQQQLIDELDPSTSNQVFDPTNQVGPGAFDKDWEQPVNEPSLDISDQTQQHLMDVTDLNISNKDQQQPIDEPSPNTSKRGRKRPIDEISPSTSSQNQQQPIDKSSNAATNQATGLSRKYQITLDDLKKRLEIFKKVAKKKLKEYCDHESLGLKEWSALKIGRKISGLKYDSDTEIRLKQEYVTANKKVNVIRQQLKRFMRKHGLKFEEPSSDSNSD